MQIELDGIFFQVIHKTNKQIKRIGISLENRDEIIVKTPLKFKAHQIREIILSHKSWILRTIQRVELKGKFDFVCGGTIPYLGNDYPLELRKESEIRGVRVIFDCERFLFFYNDAIDVENEYLLFFDALKNFYKKNAQKVIDPLFDELCFVTKLYPQGISYRYAKRQWGSCSYKNDISINYMLLQFAPTTIKYVVLHELCHVEEKNHSARFYNLVSLYMPTYKEEEGRLKQKSF